MTRDQLKSTILSKGSFLCAGIDPDPLRLPLQWRGEKKHVAQFCQEIISATAAHAVAYKLNIAFFEALGREAWDVLYTVREMLPSDCFLIADAKRADIGNSSKMYARAFFEELGFDAITVAPYMGEDSVRPFLEYADKWTIVLGLTSNSGAKDFQLHEDGAGKPLYDRVLERTASWGSPENLMFVVGATQTQQLEQVRARVPEHFLLVPGVGAQGGDLNAVVRTCLNDHVGILVNSSREILYASEGEDFAEVARQRARTYHEAMRELLDAAEIR